MLDPNTVVNLGLSKKKDEGVSNGDDTFNCVTELAHG